VSLSEFARDTVVPPAPPPLRVISQTRLQWLGNLASCAGESDP
jgi:hypothetical protein